MSFTNALRSETTKLLSLRSTIAYAILLTGSLYGPVTLAVFFGQGDEDLTWSTLMFGFQIFALIAIIFAAATTASDIRTHMHAQAFLTQDSRWQWVGAKVIVTAVFTALMFLLGTALAIGAGSVLGGNVVLGSGGQHFVFSLVGSVVFASMTVGLTCIIRSQVAAVALPVAWFLVIDGMIGVAAHSFDVFRPLAVIAPVQRLNQLIAGSGADADPLGLGLSSAVCYIVIVGWFAALTGFGLWRNQRADVR